MTRLAEVKARIAEMDATRFPPQSEDNFLALETWNTEYAELAGELRGLEAAV